MDASIPDHRFAGDRLPTIRDVARVAQVSLGTASDLLRVRARFDAVFCGSDQIARGCADALREAGIAVPAQVALVGYDNWEIIAAATRPPLTTVDMNLHELGGRAGETLIGLIDGQKPAETVLVPPRLVIRVSCGALNQAPAGDDPR